MVVTVEEVAVRAFEGLLACEGEFGTWSDIAIRAWDAAEAFAREGKLRGSKQVRTANAYPPREV